MKIAQGVSAGVLWFSCAALALVASACSARNIIGNVTPPDAEAPLAFSLDGARSFLVAGEKPWVAAADLNGDGKLDVAVANTGDLNLRAGGPLGGATGQQSTSGAVSVLLGRGDGTFDPAVDYKAGTSPSSIALGDIDGDGKLDIVVGNGTNGVNVLLGHGDGTFATAVPHKSGWQADRIALSDLDGDGRLDIVASSPNGPSVETLHNLGGNTFESFGAYMAGGSVQQLVLTDLNGDGKPDLAVAQPSASSGAGGSNGFGGFDSAPGPGEQAAPGPEALPVPGRLLTAWASLSVSTAADLRRW